MKTPLMYNGWVIRQMNTPSQGKKFCAHNLANDMFINPLYETWDQLKSIIDNLK
jgi:hypothetical protein